MIIKEIARWLPCGKLLFKQLFVSVLSFLTLPLYKHKRDGVRAFFQNNYYIEPDGLVFDGSTYGYYSKLKKIVNFDSFNDKTIIDLGCGKGAFFNWLTSEDVVYSNYIGIDFAINESREKNPYIVNDDIINFPKYSTGRNDIIIMCNSACYLDEDRLTSILNSIMPGCEIVIIDPSPNLFWDAHFDGVKPVYRRVDEVMHILENQSFVVDGAVQEYFFKLKRRFCFPISYCIHATKIG